MRRLIAASLVVLISACSSPTSATAPATGSAEPSGSLAPTLGPSPSAAPSAAPSPSLGPSPTPAIGTLDVLPPGVAVQVAVKELNLRARASTSARRVKILNRGDVLVISPLDNISFGYGPVRKNGYTWYPVVVTPYRNGTLPALPAEPVDLRGGEPTWGWVAADDGANPFLAILQPRCPVTVDLASVQGMLPAERLACFGEPIVLEGTYGCGGCGGTLTGTFKPEWIASPLSFGFLSANASDRLGPLALRFPPKGPAEPAAGTIIRVTVHVDDSRATKCTMSELSDSGTPLPVDARTAVFQCREQLVVESYDALGADPSFPLG
ncbi:MAG TPA: hypothetical protein VL749_08920 [Patescibacteria group bacterium]|nr:hypothetical protein [Patescibacteria group bacterium]